MRIAMPRYDTVSRLTRQDTRRVVHGPERQISPARAFQHHQLALFATMFHPQACERVLHVSGRALRRAFEERAQPEEFGDRHVLNEPDIDLFGEDVGAGRGEQLGDLV